MEENRLDIIIEARDTERERCRIILEYLLNKNSYPSGSHKMPKGGVDYKQAFEDIEEFCWSLTD